MIAAILLIGAVALPRLPPGICFGDAGDLQLASVTLGIAHPPGYPCLVTLGYLLTRIPGFDPAYLISIGCLLSGIIALVLVGLWQIRLGVNSWIASAIVLSLTAHPRLWINLTSSEVYMPSLAMLVGSGYLLLRFTRMRRRRDLFGAAFFFGVALFTRPPLLLAAPFYVAAAWITIRRAGWGGAQAARSWVVVVLVALAPGVYSLGYLLLRDTPSTPYNYIAECTGVGEDIPELDAGPSARLQRVTWLATAKQFRYLIRISLPSMWRKLHWLQQDLLPIQLPLVTDPLFVGVLLLAVLGLSIGIRTAPVTWALIGWIVQNLVFVCVYRIYGQAADTMPMIVSIAVLLGLASIHSFSPERARGDWLRRWIPIGGYIGVFLWTAFDAGSRRQATTWPDATNWLAEVDVPILPPDSVIVTTWDTSQPLRYARLVLFDRPDLQIETAHPAEWPERIARYPDRPVFVGIDDEHVSELYSLTPSRGLWRIER